VSNMTSSASRLPGSSKIAAWHAYSAMAERYHRISRLRTTCCVPGIEDFRVTRERALDARRILWRRLPRRGLPWVRPFCLLRLSSFCRRLDHLEQFRYGCSAGSVIYVSRH
jgi:hypothetical protein